MPNASCPNSLTRACEALALLHLAECAAGEIADGVNALDEIVGCRDLVQLSGALSQVLRLTRPLVEIAIEGLEVADRDSTGRKGGAQCD